MQGYKQHISLVLTIILAVILLVSGFAKAADTAYFSNIIFYTFHLRWMALLAPVLIVAEVGLSIWLLTPWHRRAAALATAAMLAGVTIIYIIGVAGFGMSSCGCFGHIKWLNLSPAGTLIRNLVMLGICIYLYLTPPYSAHALPPTTRYLLPLALVVAAFMSGYTMRGASVMWARSQGWQGVTIEQSPLKDLGLSQDSSYLVFTFSFNCPFCQMAVGNVSLYESSGTVDRVVAIAAADSMAEQHFLDVYQVAPFPYSTLPMEQLMQLVPELPTTFLIRHDTIQSVWTGEVPPAIFIKSN